MANESRRINGSRKTYTRAGLVRKLQAENKLICGRRGIID